MEDSYPSLNSGESMDMECEAAEKADPKDQKEVAMNMECEVAEKVGPKTKKK